MSVVYVALPVAIALAAAAVAGFIWCVRRGQMDDLDGPSIRVTYDDD